MRIQNLVLITHWFLAPVFPVLTYHYTEEHDHLEIFLKLCSLKQKYATGMYVQHERR